MRMNAKNKSKGTRTFCFTRWTMIGESLSSVQNNYDEPKDLLEW